MENTILTILGTAAVSWIGIYIKTKLDRSADKGYYAKAYKRNMYSLFLIAIFLPVSLFICAIRQYSAVEDMGTFRLGSWILVILLTGLLLACILVEFFRNKKHHYNLKYRLDSFNFLYIYYFFGVQFFLLIALYFEWYTRFGFKQDEAWFLIVIISLLSVMLSLIVHLVLRPRLKNIFFQDTYKKIKSNYQLNKKRGYFYIDETMLNDHMIFCLVNDFYCSRVPLYDLVKITGEEKRVIFFSENTIDYFELEKRKNAKLRLKNAKKNGCWK